MDRPKQLPAFFFPSLQSEERTYWRPSVDVYRTPNGWLLKFDLAGVRPEDVHVEVQGCLIRVSGVRRDLLAEEAGSYYSMEISYNRFERTISLPCEFANPHVSLEGRDGILIVRVSEG
ncbi:MAG TPA: Hsp20/alpha crystallin family protein [Bryobacteraceae bacterium]|nr:Hsp20/alpha crystallin family protein [Bryobacteraceae bacterium]HOQ46137.1 Hsp20/alpha crystallin family protein [Bryobacteraceae bacterium]HPQ14029.1 Hsp20/alpha crystallin family protein [Bryobacteraceae bacterium]HPU72722.1 Hsp20/alpha crystallin family protein [Bryobacteraceae bacterium]